MDDIGRLLVLLLQPKKLPLVNRAVLLLLIYSAQRWRTVASALRKAIIAFHERAIAFWVLDGGTTKSGRSHIPPFSLKAWSVVETWSATVPRAVSDLAESGFPRRAEGQSLGW